MVTPGFGVGDVKAVEANVALPASGRREADPQPQHDSVAVMGDKLYSAPVGPHDHPDRTRAGHHQVVASEHEPPPRGLQHGGDVREVVTPRGLQHVRDPR